MHCHDLNASIHYLRTAKDWTFFGTFLLEIKTFSSSFFKLSRISDYEVVFSPFLIHRPIITPVSLCCHLGLDIWYQYLCNSNNLLQSANSKLGGSIYYNKTIWCGPIEAQNTNLMNAKGPILPLGHGGRASIINSNELYN